MARRPSKKEVADVARGLTPGQQAKITPGIYLRKRSDGSVGYQTRLRAAGAGSFSPTRTFDTWEEADRCHREMLQEKENGSNFASRKRQRMARIEEYAIEKYWPHALETCGPLRQIEIRRVLFKDVLPFWRGTTLEQIVAGSDSRMADYKEWLRRRKITRVKDGDEVREVFHSAAYDKALGIATALLNHARRAGVITQNPFSRVPRLHSGNRRRHEGGRPIESDEVRHPDDIERIRLAMGGRGEAFRQQNRLIISLMGYLGLRPNEIIYLRHRHWRTADGPRRQLVIRRGVKDVAGHLEEGDTKNGEARSPYLWPVVAEELEALYRAQGCPDLDSLVFPNNDGNWRHYDNFRGRTWYPTLLAAGLAEGGEASSPGAFDPYVLRHTCATLMQHATKPAEHGGHYTTTEIARHLGHSERTLQDVYSHVMEDQHGLAGKTMDEIIRASRREVWGVMPGDDGYLEIELSLPEVAALTGRSVSTLGGMAARGSIPGARRDGRFWRATGVGLILAGIASPEAVASLRQAARPETGGPSL